MNQTEELEYHLQRLEATVEQMKKDSFWNKQPRRVSREAVIKDNDELMGRAKENQMNLMRTTLDVTKVEIVLIIVASLLLGGTVAGLTVNHYANKAAKNAVMNAVENCKDGKVNASTLLNVE